MKRRDWKIKKLKKTSFGNFYRRKRIFFLRKLFLRKNLVLFKKNLITNYLFYNFLLANIKKKKHEYLYNFYNFEKTNFYFIFPDFFYKKKVFNLYTPSLDFFKINKLNHIFFKKEYLNKKIGVKGNNLVVYSENFSNFLIDSEKNKDIINNLLSLKEDHPFDFNFKHFNQSYLFNYLLNYNLLNMNILEIYKIIIILYVLKLN